MNRTKMVGSASGNGVSKFTKSGVVGMRAIGYNNERGCSHLPFLGTGVKHRDSRETAVLRPTGDTPTGHHPMSQGLVPQVPLCLPQAVPVLYQPAASGRSCSWECQ